MKNNLVEKVNLQIVSGIKTDAEAVYFMVQVRKLLEDFERNIRDRYPLISFYSTWVVHTRLDRRHPGRREVLKRFNQAAFIETYLNPNKITSQTKIIKILPTPPILEGLSFYPLRREIETFTRLLNLNSSFLGNPSWYKFIQLLIEALIDSPQLPLKDEFLPDSRGYLESFYFIRKSDSQYYRNDAEAIACFRVKCKNGKELEGPVPLSAL